MLGTIYLSRRLRGRRLGLYSCILVGREGGVGELFGSRGLGPVFRCPLWEWMKVSNLTVITFLKAP